MLKLDPLTLWMANSLILAFAALVWAMLGGFYRIAPRATWLFCATAVLGIPALPCAGCAPHWAGALSPDWLRALFALLSMILLERGCRRLLHAPPQPKLPLAAGAAAVLGLVLALAGAEVLAWRVLAAAVTVLAVASTVLLYRGTEDARQLRAARWALCLPIAGIAVDFAFATLAGHPPRRNHVFSQLLPVALELWISLSLMALAVRRLWQRIDHLARHDPLTGLLNRRALMEALAQAQARRRRGLPFSWIVVDIDHFKQINDALGHAAGDAALCQVAELLRSECRSSDALARLGGEEFGLLLPGSTLADAQALAERLRLRLHAAPLQWEGKTWPLRASFGVTLTREGDDEAGEALLQRADALLYRAKAAGRDRVLADGMATGQVA